MKTITMYRCEKCGYTLECAEAATRHESDCLPLEVGQLVEFQFGLFIATGRITDLRTPAMVGAEATVDLETEEELAEVGPFHDGKHVWVTRSKVQRII